MHIWPSHLSALNTAEGTSLVAQWFRLHLPMQGVPVQSLVWELMSMCLMAWTYKQSNTVVISIKTLKITHIGKKKLKKKVELNKTNKHCRCCLVYRVESKLRSMPYTSPCAHPVYRDLPISPVIHHPPLVPTPGHLSWKSSGKNPWTLLHIHTVLVLGSNHSIQWGKLSSLSSIPGSY